MEVRTTTGTHSTWTGRYLYGRQTYIEFFGPSDFSINGSPAPVGSWGIALSGDRVGANAALRKSLEALGHTALVGIDTRALEDRTVPWFEALTAITKHGDSGGLGEAVSVWAMEYQPSYLDLPEVAKEPPEGPDDVISRERYQSDLYATKLMRDVTHVHFDVGQQDFARIEPLLRAAGYRMARSGSEIRAVGRGSSFRFSLTDRERRGLRQVVFALNAPVARHVETIGASRLDIGPDATATWTFPRPD